MRDFYFFILYIYTPLINNMFRKILFLTFIISGSGADCPSREKALDCFYKVADQNHDGFISQKELSHAIGSRLPWWKNAAFHLFGGFQRIINDCDANHDNKLTKEESLQMTETCMESCYKKKNTYELFKCS